MRTARIICRKCNTPIRMNFGDLTFEQARERLAESDRIPRECPGFHVELGGWSYYWRHEDALRQAYPEAFDPSPIEHRYILISPDELPLCTMNGELVIANTREEAEAKLTEYIERYRQQGYYKDSNCNRIPFEHIAEHCRIERVTAESLQAEAAMAEEG